MIFIQERAKVLCISLSIYLAFFFSACAPRAVSISEARQMQTRIVYTGYADAIDAVVTALQDHLYIIDDVDHTSGILVASRSTDLEISELVQEEKPDEFPLWMKIFGVALLIVVVGVIIGAITHGKNEDSDECEHHEHHDSDRHHHGHPFVGGSITYRYRLNVTFKDEGDNSTKIRIIAQGEKYRSGKLVDAGTIQDPEYYYGIFNQINNVINN